MTMLELKLAFENFDLSTVQLLLALLDSVKILPFYFEIANKILIFLVCPYFYNLQKKIIYSSLIYIG